MADARTPPFRLNLGRFIVYAVLLFAVCFYGIPLLWLLLAGTRSQSSLFADPPFSHRQLGDVSSPPGTT